MVRIALSGEFLRRWGGQIREVAPGEIELAVVDGAGDEAWHDAEILLKSEFADGATPEQVIAKMPRVRWVHTIYAGTNDMPWGLTAGRDIVVTNSAGVYAPMMAEYVIAMLIALYRKLPAYLTAQRERRWETSRAHERSNEELYGKRMGIIGYGATGRQLAHAAKGLGMHVMAMRRTPAILANEPVERMLGADELDVLLRENDIVVICASLNSSTRGLLGLNEFKKMKAKAVLVNVARGAIVDEEALLHALKEGWLRGAILDVTAIEPLPADSPLWDAPNLLITPHISGEMPIGRERAIKLFCDNLRLYLKGQMESFGNRVEVRAHT